MTIPEIWLIVAPLVLLALSLATSAHILLTKRDVRSAIAWVGLALLAPLLGSLAYVLLGINRVHRKATRIRGRTDGQLSAPNPHALSLDEIDPEGPVADLVQLARLGERLSGLPVMRGNRVDLLRNGDEAYPAMVDAISTARHSVLLSSYIFRADAAGTPIIDALIDARRRGVEVRVLLDGIGSGYLSSRAVDLLQRGGVSTARFLHSFLPWRMAFINMRTHKKILVADGRTGFTGGLNIGAENLVNSGTAHPVSDTHFRIEGPVVEEMVSCFADDWAFTTGEVLEGQGYYPDLEPRGEVYARVISSGPDESLERLYWTIAGALSRARTCVRIVTPYFLPEQKLMEALILTALRGVRIELVIPGVSNHRIMDWAARPQYDQLLDRGCHVFRSGHPFDHSKLMTVDGSWALFGSANWDARSLRLNFELNVECYGRDVADLIDRHIDHKVSQATPLGRDDLAGRGYPGRLRDAVARLFLPYL